MNIVLHVLTLMLQNCLLTYVPTNRGSSIVFSDNFKASDGVGDTLSPIQAFAGTFLTHIQHLTNDVSPKLKMGSVLVAHLCRDNDSNCSSGSRRRRRN